MTVIALLVIFALPAYGSPSFKILNVKGSPMVSFRIIVKCGSINDPKGREGLSALTAYLISGGGTGEKDSKAVLNALYPLAASVNAQPGKEETVFTGDIHRDNLEKYYPLFTGLLLRPSFKDEDFRRIREDLLNGIVSGLRSGNDEQLGKEALDLLLHQEHPYGHLVEGTVQGLKSITLDDVKEFYRRHYVQGNIIIGLAGTDLSSLKIRLGEDFGALPTAIVKPVSLPARGMPEGLQVMLIEKECISTAISIGFPIDVTRSDRDFYPLMVMNSYFGEHRTFHGILMNHMRADRGLNYGDYSYIEHFVQDGGGHFMLPNIPRRQQLFSIWIRPVSHGNRHFALRQAVRELKMLVEKGISREDFEITRTFVLNYSRLWVQSQSRRLGYMLDSDYYGTPFFLDEVEKALGALTLDDVNAALRRHLQAENMAIAAVTQDAASFKKALVENAPSPITYPAKVPQRILDEDREIEVFPLRIDGKAVRIVTPEDLFER
jgi:zinc protease